MEPFLENQPLEVLEIDQPLPLRSHVTVVLDGEPTDFELAMNGKVLLNAAIDAGVDAPWSCRAGVCCTCKARLLEGKVEMKTHYGLTEEEIEQGYILTCQSHPVTDRVVVDYDV